LQSIVGKYDEQTLRYEVEQPFFSFSHRWSR